MEKSILTDKLGFLSGRLALLELRVGLPRRPGLAALLHRDVLAVLAGALLCAGYTSAEAFAVLHNTLRIVASAASVGGVGDLHRLRESVGVPHDNLVNCLRTFHIVF